MKELQKYNQPNIIAACVSFFAGIFIHLFSLVNVIHNYDNIGIPYGYGTGITSGRWLLTLLGNFFQKLNLLYNLPWMWGFFLILFLAISVYFLISIFHIKSRMLACLLGIIFVCFPTVSSTLFFRYTVLYYGLAIFFSVLAAYVIIQANHKFIFFVIFSALLSACSMGIYQAYLPITTAIMLLSLIQQTIENTKSWKEIFQRALYYLFSLILGIVFYFLLLNFSLYVTGEQLSSYQGMNAMGQLSLIELPHLVWHAFVMFLKMPFENLYTLAPISFMKYLYVALALISFLMMVYVFIKKQLDMSHKVLLILFSVVFPIAVNLMEILSSESRIYSLMVYSFSILFFVPVVLFESISEGKMKKLLSRPMIGLFIAFIFFFSYLSNVNDTRMYYVNRQAENYFSTMVAQIRMSEGFDVEKKWAFIGKIQDPLFYNIWDKQGPFFGGTTSTQTMISTYSWQNWITYYVGYSRMMVDPQILPELSKREEVKQMPDWPNKGSIQVIDDYIVIKFSDDF